MNRIIKLIYLLVLLSLISSCAESKGIKKEANPVDSENTATANKLTFTSGVRSILQDSKGNYWFGSKSEGVGFYDGKTYTYFTRNDGLPDNQIRTIQEDNKGRIWFGTSNGVSVYDGKKFSNYSTQTDKPTLTWEETNGNLWFPAGPQDGIYRFDGIRMNYVTFPKPKNEKPDHSYGVTDISIGKDSVVWIATYTALFNFNGKTITRFGNDYFHLKSTEELHVRSVLADSKGRVWIGNNGIGVILKQGDSFAHFSKEQGKLLPMDTFDKNTQTQQFANNTGLQSVFAIEEDAEGNIWFGDRDSGAWRYDGESLTNYTVDKGLPQSMIWTIYKDKQNRLLFGMENGSIYVFNGETFDRAFNE